MEKQKINLLLVDDDEDDFLLTSEYLQEIKDKVINVTWVPTFEKGVDEIKRNCHDILIFDFLLGGRNGIDLLIAARQLGCESPVILLTGRGDHKTDMEAMKLGASDYLVKNELDTEKLDRSIRYALERAAASRALKLSEEKYRNIFEKSRDMIYITDINGNFIDFNESAIRIFGYSREELLTLDAKELYYNQEDRFNFLELINKTGAVSNHEIILKHKSGEKRFCLVSGTIQRVSGSAGDTINYLGMIHDITRRKKAEKDLIIAEKLAVTGRVVRTLAHEIRNPLTNINLSLEQIQSESTDQELLPYFDIIKRNSKRINDLITDLLHSSKPTEVKTLKYSINEIIDDTLQMAMDRLILKGIKIEKQYVEDACDIFLDKEKIKIALLNIIINAIEAMPEKEGILSIRTQTLDNKCLVLIQDNGVGISKDQIGRLFEPYFTNKSNGMGLGLATTHNILQSHKAVIDVDSEIGKGTRFTISFELDKLKQEL